ncbi:hypothetical protein PVAP13_4KG162100 [Panicum virgatum]|uniref:Uncharacterized protein n=1 Tax=Panicum virgatum TaxID=38727 RepID=A0A8T0TRA0_PANVG|nr:hypothetical protein PVAP13_4KG162100 [Panicum virgatum]
MNFEQVAKNLFSELSLKCPSTYIPRLCHKLFHFLILVARKGLSNNGCSTGAPVPSWKAFCSRVVPVEAKVESEMKSDKVALIFFFCSIFITYLAICLLTLEWCMNIFHIKEYVFIVV